ncbi:MAG: hypothetical protein GOVbin1573_69 [Prokaryotic dsDNA virus sp.]|nr:MAG: hypothetical protein GOVbin1573_69 [Prokaryotic dsDNA virus sp.]|tara:strand:+ start:1062 stop:1301 length:240 start_codon:yes stop_codon:yes gene_type:complete
MTRALRQTHAHHRRRFRDACARAHASGVDLSRLSLSGAMAATDRATAAVGLRYVEMVEAFSGEPAAQDTTDPRQGALSL